MRRTSLSLLAMCILVVLAGTADFDLYLLDILSHFRIQALACCIVILALAFWQRFWLVAAASAICLSGGIIATVAESDGPELSPESHRASFRLVSFNVNYQNQNYAEVSKFLKDQTPDVVLIVESNPEWVARLEKDMPHLSYVDSELRDDNFGISLHSRFPVVETKRRFFGHSKLPSLIAKIEVAGSSLWLIGIHLLPPISQIHYELRNEDLNEIVGLAVELGHNAPVVIAGDFNLTRFSNVYRKALNGSGLIESSRQILRFTWPAFFPPLGVEIDHIWTNKKVNAISYHVGPNLGSDHYPLTVNLALP